ncbi:MAG: hypothetical protein ACR2F6_02810 [Mycobacteriales bacterium]
MTRTLVRALRFAVASSPRLVGGTFASQVLLALCVAALPYFIRTLVDDVADGRRPTVIVAAAMAMVGIVVLQRLLALAWSSLTASHGEAADDDWMSARVRTSYG